MKLEMQLIFCMQIDFKVSTSWHYCFDASRQTNPNTQSRKLAIFLQYINKVLQLLLRSIVMQNIVQIFYGVQSY